MFSHHHKQRGKQSTPAPTSQFALAAARAIVPPRSQTPTLSAAAAAAALHASPKQVTSPGAVVTRRMERRGSVTSVGSAAPPVHGQGLARRSSDASMTERIGWLREQRDDDPNGGGAGGRSSNSRPSSRDAPVPKRAKESRHAPVQDRVLSPTRQLESRHAPVQNRVLSPTRQLESRHAPVQDRVLSPTRQLESRHAAKPQQRQQEEEEPRKPKTKKVATRPKATPSERAPEPTYTVATAKPKPKAKATKPKPKPKPVEPVYYSDEEDEEEEEEEEEEERPVRYRRVRDSESEPEYDEPRQTSNFQMKKSLRSTPVEAAARAVVKKKNIQPVHSDTQGSMLTRGTMRTTVRDDMTHIVDEAKERQKAARITKPALQESSHAPKTYQEPARDDTGPSDEVKALALAIMRSQQAEASKKPLIAPSKRAQRRKQAAAPPPDTAEDDGEVYEAERQDEPEEDLDPSVYKRNAFAGSASSVGSLESIPEEAVNGDFRTPGGKKKRRSNHDSIIIPGKDGVPALPISPILEKERSRLAKVQSPEPSENITSERQRTLDKLTGDRTTSKPAAAKTKTKKKQQPEETKISPPSSATLTEELFQPVIQTTPPTPPATSENYHEPRFVGIDAAVDDFKPAKVEENHLHPRMEISPPLDSSALKPVRRHSPPPRSLSPAKSALKHTHYEGSDKSSILSAEDSSVGGSVSGRRKHIRVSFSEDPAVVEMDDNDYHYKPIHSTLAAAPKQPSKGISGVSFSSISRTRVEHTPSPEPQVEHSADSRLGGLIGGELLDKIKTKVSKNKDIASPVSPSPVSPLNFTSSVERIHTAALTRGKGIGASDPLAPEIVSISPPPSTSDEEFDDDLQDTPSPASLEIERNKPAVSSPLQAVTIAEELVPDEPKDAQISAGHTPPAVDLKPIFPPHTSDLTGATATLSENISHGRRLENVKSDSDSEDDFADAYEDLDHVVVSPTGSGAVLGVTTGHTVQAESTGATEEVVLPSISEVVTDQPLDDTKLNRPTKSLAPDIAGGPLPEQAITDERGGEQKTIFSPKPIQPVSPRLISAHIAPDVQHADPAEAVEPAVAPKRTKAQAPKPSTSTKTSNLAKKSALTESRHAPKTEAPTKTTKTSPAVVAAPTSGGKLRKQKQPPVLQRNLSVSSDDSESSFQRENPQRREARRTQGKGFSMRTSMRDSNGVIPPPSRDSARDSGLGTSKWAAPTSPQFESGFRSGRTFGTGGPRRREYSPDSSDGERKVIQPKAEKKGFFGKSTLRGSNSRPTSSHAPAPKDTGKGKGGFGFRSRFDDSSDEDNEPISYRPQPTAAEQYRPLTPDSSDDEDAPQANSVMETPSSTKTKESGTGTFLGKSTLRDSTHAPQGAAQGLAPLTNGFTTTVSSDAEMTPKKKWWSFGSKRGSRPPSRAGSVVAQPVVTQPITPKPVLSRRTTDPESLDSPPPSRPQMKKFRKNSSGSVTSIGSSQTWTPMSLGTSTLTGSPSGNRTLTHKLSGLQEVEEEDERNSPPLQAQTVEPNGGIYGSAKSQKKKKFPRLRKMFRIDD